ncbi:hypothetical protein B4U79_08111, partial [Dinothrombium tinctorium]
MAKRHLNKNQLRQVKRLGKQHKQVTFEKGQLVLLNSPIGSKGKRNALEQNFHGPYRIIMQVNKNNYELEEIPQSDKQRNLFKGIVHIKYMRPYLKPLRILQNEKEMVQSDSEPESDNPKNYDYRPDMENKLVQRKRGRPRKPCQLA